MTAKGVKMSNPPDTTTSPAGAPHKEPNAGGTWVSTVAGILDIVSGALSVIGSAIMAVLGNITHHTVEHYVPNDVYIPISPGALFSGLAVMALVFGLLALAGGVYAVQRRAWGWALVGSIAAALCFFPLGVPAVILTIVAEGEFRREKR